MFPNSYITIERLVEDPKITTTLGSPKKTPSIIVENLEVCLLEDTEFRLKNIIDYAELGQVDITYFKLTCNTFIDIQMKDIIIFNGTKDNAQINLEEGAKFTVIALPYVGNIIPHVKAILKMGVS